MNRLTTETATPAETTRVVHVRAQDAFAPSSVDELLNTKAAVAKQERAQPWLSQFFTSWWTRGIVAAVVVLGLLPEALYVANDKQADANLQELRNLGVPVTQADLTTNLPSPFAPNNAMTLHKTANLILGMGALANAYQRLIEYDINYPPTWPNFRVQVGPQSDMAALQALKPAIESARAVAETNGGSCVFWKNTSIRQEGDRWAFDNAEQTQQVVHLLYSAGFLELRSGQLDLAKRDLRDAATIARNAKFPLMPHTQLADTKLPIHTMSDMMANMWLTAREMKDNSAALDVLADTAGLMPQSNESPLEKIAEGMPYEIQLYELAKSDPMRYAAAYGRMTRLPGTKGDPQPNILVNNKFFDRYLVRNALEDWGNVFRYGKAHPDNYGGLLDQLKRSQAHMDSLWPHNILLTGFRNGAQGWMGPSEPSAIMMNRLRADGIRALAYRARHGAFPPSLSSFGADAVDGFNGKPLSYHTSRTGFTISSVGLDLVDNHEFVPKPDVLQDADISLRYDANQR